VKVIVVLDLNEYIEKMERSLLDNNTYVTIDKEPTKKFIGKLQSLLVRWKNIGFDELTYKRLLITEGNISRSYGFPKIHEIDCPLRIIVSIN